MDLNLFLKKLGFSLFSLIAIVSFTFMLMKAIPGNPFADEEAIPQEVIKSMNTYYGLDRPLYWQYILYLSSIVTWDFGPSLKEPSRSVNEVIIESFPVSALLGSVALLLAVTLGVSVGILSTLYSSRWQDHSLITIATLGISIPSFILAALLQYVLAFKFSLFPAARWGTFSHLVLPAISLAAFPSAIIARLTRSSMIEVLKQEYIRAAFAKGISKSRIILYHALKNALLPVVAYLGQISASILIGSFVVEKIFAIPGLGQSLILAVVNRDYPVIMGVTVFYSFIFLSLMLIVDLILIFLDPRLRGREEVN